MPPTTLAPIPWQATCVALDSEEGARALMIEGPPGSGKSSLALALLDRGARLVGDDGVMLEACGERLFAHPHPATRGLLEVRNVGLIDMPVCEHAPVALVVLLDPAAPRHLERAETMERAGIALPMLRLWPDSPVLALRAEIALARFGLRG